MPNPKSLDRGKKASFSLATATTDLTADDDGTPYIDCGGASTLLVKTVMVGAADADLTVLILPFESDNATVFPILVPLPAVFSSGPKYDGSANVWFIAQYDVTCLDKVQYYIKNNNAGTKNVLEKSWRLA